MKFIRHNNLNEGYFKTPAQIKQEKEKNVSNAERIASKITSNVIFPSFKKLMTMSGLEANQESNVM